MSSDNRITDKAESLPSNEEEYETYYKKHLATLVVTKQLLVDARNTHLRSSVLNESDAIGGI